MVDVLGGLMTLAELFALSLVIGVVAPLAGVGGGVLFTPILLGFTDIHPDLVRATGLAIATYSSIMAGTTFFKQRLSPFKLVVLASAILMPGAIVGAQVGVYITATMGTWGSGFVRTVLGVVMFAVVTLLLLKRIDWPEARCDDKLVRVFGLEYFYHEKTLGKEVRYCPRRVGLGLFLLFFVGFASGFFGLGAAWALIPIYNLVMSLPLKVAAATANTSIAIADSAALWVYIHGGKIYPEIYIAGALAVILGAKIGARLMLIAPTRPIRLLIIGIMIFNGIQLIMRGLKEMGVV